MQKKFFTRTFSMGRDKIISNTKIIPPSIKRYIQLFLKPHGSIARTLQYEKLRQITLSGKVLDFGGGENAKYRNNISCKEYFSINIDPAIKPTWITQVGQNFPCNDQTFDTVLSLNTLEHIFDPTQIIKEFSRVLKDDGTLIAAVPFLFPVHGHPDDFFRPTSSWWEHILKDNNFSSLEIYPLVWGPFTTGITASGLPGPFKKFRMHIALLLDILYYHLNPHSNIENRALSFFIIAKK